MPCERTDGNPGVQEAYKQMIAHGLFADEEIAANLLIDFTRREMNEYFSLALGESGGKRVSRCIGFRFRAIR